MASGTTLSFELEASEHVVLRVHDASGRVVATLLDGRLAAGPHRIEWNGTAGDGVRVPAGAYLLSLKRHDGLQMARKVTVLGD